MGPDDLPEAWADILPPRRERVEPSPEPVLRDHVWLALLGPADVEPTTVEGYRRVPVRVPEGTSMVFDGEFGPMAEPVTVESLALFTTRQAGEMVWQTSFERLVIRPGDTCNLRLRIDDVGGTAARFGCGWRALLKTKGIL